MPDFIDEEGNLFGLVNVIDALVVLLVVAVVVAGLGLVLGGDRPDTTQNNTTQNDTAVVYVDYQSDPLQPYVADVIPEGPVQTANITSIENKSVSPSSVVTQNQSGALSVQTHPRHRTVTFRIGLTVTRQDGEYLYAGTQVEVGRQLTLDVGPTTISGQVTAVEPTEP